MAISVEFQSFLESALIETYSFAVSFNYHSTCNWFGRHFSGLSCWKLVEYIHSNFSTLFLALFLSSISSLFYENFIIVQSSFIICELNFYQVENVELTELGEIASDWLKIHWKLRVYMCTSFDLLLMTFREASANVFISHSRLLPFIKWSYRSWVAEAFFGFCLISVFQCKTKKTT